MNMTLQDFLMRLFLLGAGGFALWCLFAWLWDGYDLSWIGGASSSAGYADSGFIWRRGIPVRSARIAVRPIKRAEKLRAGNGTWDVSGGSNKSAEILHQWGASPCPGLPHRVFPFLPEHR